MLVVCKNTGGYHLTLGKTYNVNEKYLFDKSEFSDKPIFDYLIINDLGVEHGVESDIFITLKEERDMKINSIIK
jgi:hypothetical protein